MFVDTKLEDEAVDDGGDAIIDACDEEDSGDFHVSSTMDATTAAATADSAIPQQETTSTRTDKPSKTATKENTKPKKGALHKVSKIVKNWASSPRRLRASTKVRSKAGKASPKTPPQKARKNGRTKPATPQVLRRSSSVKKKTILTSEQREMEAIAAKREEANKRRRISRDSFKRLSRSGFEKQSQPSKSVKQLTVPKAPKFANRTVADGRPPKQSLKHTTKPDVLHSDPMQHRMVLRSEYKPINTKQTRTQPKPFKMSSRLLPSAKKKKTGSPFKSMVEKLHKFTSTPQRFRKPRHDTKYQAQDPAPKPALTRPVSPKFASKGKESADIETHEDREERMMSEIKPFKANAFNPAIKDSAGDYGVPRILSKGCTIPSTPTFKTKQRAEERQTTEPALATTAAPAFTARKAPDFTTITGLPPKQVKRSTVVQPPATQLERKRHMASEPEPLDNHFKAHPVPDSTPFQVQHDHKTTVQKPFLRSTLHSNPSETRKQLQRQTEIEEAKQRAFKANPLPENEEPSGLPEVAKRPSTKPHPFNLRSLAMHEKEVHSFETKKLRLEDERRQRALFKAQEVKGSEKYVPAKSTKPLTQIQAFSQTSDTRAMYRKAFDSKVKHQKETEDKIAQLLAVERAAIDRVAVIKARKETVHKAHPVPTYTVMKVRASDKLLTEPASPMLGGKRFTAMRA